MKLQRVVEDRNHWSKGDRCHENGKSMSWLRRLTFPFLFCHSSSSVENTPKPKTATGIANIFVVTSATWIWAGCCMWRVTAILTACSATIDCMLRNASIAARSSRQTRSGLNTRTISGTRPTRASSVPCVRPR